MSDFYYFRVILQSVTMWLDPSNPWDSLGERGPAAEEDGPGHGQKEEMLFHRVSHYIYLNP